MNKRGLGGKVAALIRTIAVSLALAGSAGVARAETEPAMAGGGFVVLKADGSVWTSQLWQFPQEHVRIAGLPPVKGIAFDNENGFAFDADGKVWRWPANCDWHTPETTPCAPARAKPVAGISRVIGLAAGNDFVLFLRGDGSVWGMGRNDWGQLGSIGVSRQAKARVDRPRPIPVLHDIRALAANDLGGMALDGHGRVWAWGLRSKFSGDGFVEVCEGNSCALRADLPPMVRVAVGYRCYAEAADGAIWAWGNSTFKDTTEHQVYPFQGPRKLDLGRNAHLVAAIDELLVVKDDEEKYWWVGNGGRDAIDPRRQTVDWAAPKGALHPLVMPGEVKALSFGMGYHSAMLADGTIWTWEYLRTAPRRLDITWK